MEKLESMAGSLDKRDLTPIGSMAAVWLPFVGDYRTFLDVCNSGHAQLFHAVAGFRQDRGPNLL